MVSTSRISQAPSPVSVLDRLVDHGPFSKITFTRYPEIKTTLFSFTVLSFFYIFSFAGIIWVLEEC